MKRKERERERKYLNNEKKSFDIKKKVFFFNFLLSRTSGHVFKIKKNTKRIENAYINAHVHTHTHMTDADV